MANEEPSKFSSNPKVPPLKIVFSSHHNNAVVNVSSVDDVQIKSTGLDNTIADHEQKDLSRRNSLEVNGERLHKKNPKASSERNEPESIKASGFSSSSSSSSSDRSDSTSPSSESESLASNSTIISEHPQVKIKIDSKEKDDGSSTKQEKVSRCNFKVSSTERSSNSGSNLHGKKSQESNPEQVGPSGDPITSASRDQTLNANQRITRSSQRAAQQSKTDNSSEQNGDEHMVSENQEKAHESSRKVKRKKGEPQDSEQDSTQQSSQPTIAMANICPSDYQLPSQNSFELYRDIRKRPYKKLMKLSHIQPRVPYGFKDYLLNGGPYLLDGNKLGVGLNGSRIDALNTSNDSTKNGPHVGRVPLRMKLSNLQKLSSYHPSQHRHTSYTIPTICEAPSSLQAGSPLHELFLDQEKARHQMRMQHLKERERSILAAEQEILRAYNKAAIADVNQKLHLSACTYFYYQERYHYINEKSATNGSAGSKEVPHSQDNSFLCIEGGEAKSMDSTSSSSKNSKGSSTEKYKDTDMSSTQEERKSDSENPVSDNKSSTSVQHFEEEKIRKDSSNGDAEKGCTPEDQQNKSIQRDKSLKASVGKVEHNDSNQSDVVMSQETRSKSASKESESKDEGGKESEKNGDQEKNLDSDSDTSISEELKLLNKEAFLNQLQEIDDKWDKIKKDMLVRHRNEADSLHAVQSLEWEWKAKETGACDVRVSLKIEPEFVPRVKVEALDY